MKTCIEDMMRMNNGAALTHMFLRFGLNPEGCIPGTGISYMQKAIECAADNVVQKLLEAKVDPNKKIGSKTPIAYVLEEERKLLNEKASSRENEEKKARLLMIAGALLNSGAKIAVRKNKTIVTPIREFIAKQSPQYA